MASALVGPIGTGYGEAQIFQGNKGLDILLRRQQMQNQAAVNQFRYQQWLDRQQQMRDRDLMKMDFTKPGTFQQEESLKEIGQHRKNTYEKALRNPDLSGLSIKEAMAADEAQINQNIAKRNAVQESLKQHQQEYLKDKGKFDTEAMTRLRSRLLYDVDQNGNLANKNISEINNEDIDAMMYHPSVYNNNALVIDALGPIKSQMTYAPEGTVVNTPFGQLEKSTQHGVRFKDIGETTNYLIHSDPRIENKAYWQVAQDQVKANGEDPTNIDRVQQVYDQIRTDPKFTSLVYEKVEPIVKQLQTEVNKKYTKSIGVYTQGEKENTVLTEDDYKKVHQSIDEVRDAATFAKKQIALPKEGQETPVEYHNEKIDRLVESLNGGIWDNKQIISATPEWEANRIKLSLMNTTETDIFTGNKKEYIVDRYVDMNNDNQMEQLFRQGLPEVKAKKWDFYKSKELRKKGKLDSVGAPTSVKKGRLDDIK